MGSGLYSESENKVEREILKMRNKQKDGNAEK